MNDEVIAKRLVAKAMRVTAKESVKWADVEWRERSKILEGLISKYGLTKYYGRHNDIMVYLADEIDHSLQASVNWYAIGSTSIDKTKKFAKELIEVADKLEKAVAEFKKMYPEVKITSK